MEQSQYEQILKAIESLSERLHGLQFPKHSNRSHETKDLFAALSQAQLEMPIAGLNKTNPYFMMPYADLAEVITASRPALAKNGLSVMQQILTTDEGQSILNTILCHSSGQWIQSQNRITPPKNDIQTLSSYIASLKRIAYGSLIGVVISEEDDDGEIAMANAREIIAKGTTINSYNPKDQSHDTISKEQLNELEYELAPYPDLAEEVLDQLRIQSLASMPKSKYHASITRIRKIKAIREGTLSPASLK